jgi:hypothetical protein
MKGALSENQLKSSECEGETTAGRSQFFIPGVVIRSIHYCSHSNSV